MEKTAAKKRKPVSERKVTIIRPTFASEEEHEAKRQEVAKVLYEMFSRE